MLTETRISGSIYHSRKSRFSDVWSWSCGARCIVALLCHPSRIGFVVLLCFFVKLLTPGMVDASCGVSQDATDVTIPDYKFWNMSQTVANWLVTAHSCFSQNSIQVTSRPMNSLLSSRSTRSRPSRSRFAQEKSFLASRPPSRNCAQTSVYVLRIKSKKTGTHSQRTVVNLHNSGYPSKWEVTNALVLSHNCDWQFLNAADAAWFPAQLRFQVIT